MKEERKQPLSFLRAAMMVCSAGRAGRILVAPVFVLLACSVTTLATTFVLFPPDTLTPREQLTYAGQLMLFACMATAFFASGRARALAFMRVLPAVHTPRALILLPAFVVGLAVAVVASLFVPPLSALALLGWWCWAASVGLRFAFGSGWLLLLLGTPLVYLGPLVAAAIATPFAGPDAPALSAPVLGLVGYLASHRALSPDLFPGTSSSRRQPRSRPFVNNPLGRGSRIWTPVRFFGVVAPAGVTIGTAQFAVWASIFTGAIAALTWIGPLENPMMHLVVVMIASGRLAEANLPARVEFLSTRPLALSSLRWTLVVPWALIAVLAPTIGLVRVTMVTTIPLSDLRKLPYPTAVIITAAAFPAASDPGDTSTPADEDQPAFRGATPVPVTPALRTLMTRYLASLVLLHWASFGTMTAFFIARARKSGRWRHWAYFPASLLIPIVILFNAVERTDRLSLDQTSGHIFPPLWVPILLAVLGAWVLRRSLRLPLRA